MHLCLCMRKSVCAGVHVSSQISGLSLRSLRETILHKTPDLSRELGQPTESHPTSFRCHTSVCLKVAFHSYSKFRGISNYSAYASNWLLGLA